MAVQAWQVFGRIGLSGLGESIGKLKTFEAAGASAADQLRDIRSMAGLAAGGVVAASGVMAAALGGLATKEFASFDEAMTESLAIMGDVSKAMREDMAAAARKVARTTTFSAEQAAKGFFFLASAGLDAKESLAALPEVAEFAQAGNFDLARATELATDAQSALGLKAEDTAENLENLRRVQDVLVKANQLSNATVEQFSEALTNRAAPALKAANKSLEEGAALLAVFADQGIKGRRAGMQLSRVLRLLAQNAAENRDLFRELGIITPEGNLKSLAEIVEILTEDLRGLSDAEKSARLEQLGFTARVQQAIKPLLGNADAVRRYRRQLEQAGGAAEEVANKQLQTLNKQFDLLKGEVEAAGIRLGSMIAPGVEKDVRALRIIVRNLTTAVADLGDESKETSGILDNLDLGVIASSIQGTFPAAGLVTGREQWETLRDAILAASGATEDFRKKMESLRDLPGEPPVEVARRAAPGGFASAEMQKAFREQTTGPSDIARINQQRKETVRRVEDALRKARSRRIEEQLGLTSRLIRKRRRELETLIRQDAKQADILQKARQLVQLQERAATGPVVKPTALPERLQREKTVTPDLTKSALVPGAGPKPMDIISPGPNEAILRDLENEGKRGGDRLLSALEQRLITGGAHALEGLIQGLRQGAGAGSIIKSILQIGATIGSALLGIPGGGAIIGGLFGALGIGSPAERGIFAGRMVGRGLVEGLSGMKNPVAKAADDLAQAASVRATAKVVDDLMTGGAMSGGFAGVSGGGAPVVFDFSEFPEPTDPRQAARDRDWRRFFQETGRFVVEDVGSAEEAFGGELNSGRGVRRGSQRG